MQTLGALSRTLFYPLLGRIYAAEHFPDRFPDEAALSLRGRIPPEVREQTLTQYACLASAVRSVKMDACCREFLSRHPGGTVVNLGCGLDTSFQRNDDGAAHWFDIDLPEVIAYRRTLLPESARETFIAADAFADDWRATVRGMAGQAPLLVMAGGLFHYFEKEKVLRLLRKIIATPPAIIVFDTVSPLGIRLARGWLRQSGYGDAHMTFCVPSAEGLAKELGHGVRLIKEEPFYLGIDRAGFDLMTKLCMAVSDRFRMVKMIYLEAE